jgi:NADH-quinone oxidoreductase subunit G
MMFGLYSSRFMLEDKVHKPKRVDLGPIVLDAERCVLCSRCVRFCSEVTKTSEMEIFERGDHSEIRTYQGQKLDKNKYAGNLVDICPVGALTSRDFRFRCRAWFLKTAESICPGCANGCNICIHYGAPRYVNFENAKIYRLMPRYNPEVNRSWLCDAGRLSYKLANSPTRLNIPAVRPRWTPVGREPYIPDETEVTEDTSLSPVLAGYYGTGWNEALGYIASEIKKVIDESGGDAIGAIASSRLTNEDLFVLKKFMHGVIGSRHLDYRVTPRVKGDEDNFLIKSDKTPNSRGAEEILLNPGYKGLTIQGMLDAIMGNKIKALLVIEQDLYRADVNWDIVQMALHAMEMTVVMSGNLNMTVSLARVQLPLVSFAETEGTYTNYAGRVQRLYPALPPKEKAKPAWQALVELSRALGKELPYHSAEEVFTDLSREVPAYRGLSYEKIGGQGAMIGA